MKGQLPEFWSFNRMRDAPSIQTKELLWQGPFSWIGYEKVNNMNPMPDIAGVYLFTFESTDGYIMRLIGIANSMKRRFLQHTRAYYQGNYTVLDVESAKRGIRKELWHGWQYARENRSQFTEHEDEIRGYVAKELIASRIFVAEVAESRIRERIEAAVVLNSYCSKEPWADMIDAGMAIRKRFTNEMPIKMRNISSYKIYGLPEMLEI